VSHHRFITRFVPVLAASSLLAACSGGTASAPPFPAPQNPSNSAAQAVARAVQSSSHGADPHASPTPAPASPASLEFTADQAAAGTPQTVTIDAKDDGVLRVSIAGTGNCPTVSPSTIKPQRDVHDNRDHDGHDVASAVITVTPAGAGPATCLITVKNGDGDGDHHDGDGDGDRHGSDRDRHGDGDCDKAITIPVIVDAPATPAPTPTPVVR
jgi:hypothetical protein